MNRRHFSFRALSAMARCALPLALAVATGAAQSGEPEIRSAVEAALGAEARVGAIREASVLGLYEVQVGVELFYTDADGRYLFLGDVVDLGSRRNLTRERKGELSRIDFSELPLDLAARQVRGSGRRVLATFEDPNCPYCRKLAEELETLDDITVYTFLLPILSRDSADKARAIWCAADRGRAWHDWILDGKAPPQADCDAPLDQFQALAEKYGITGTPTLFLSDGTRLGGYVPAARLEEALARAARNRPAQ